MKEVVLKLDCHDEKTRKRAMKTVSVHSGVESISLDWKEMKLTVIGDIDPVSLARKLRKLCCADILSVGPQKSEEKKKEEPTKDPNDAYKLMKSYEAIHYPTVTPFYYARPVQEDPSACVIC